MPWPLWKSFKSPAVTTIPRIPHLYLFRYLTSICSPSICYWAVDAMNRFIVRLLWVRGSFTLPYEPSEGILARLSILQLWWPASWTKFYVLQTPGPLNCLILLSSCLSSSHHSDFTTLAPVNNCLVAPSSPLIRTSDKHLSHTAWAQHLCRNYQTWLPIALMREISMN